jgi:hypothetical protein
MDEKNHTTYNFKNGTYHHCELDIPAGVIVTYSHYIEPLSMARGRF